MSEKKDFPYALKRGTLLKGREYSYRIVDTLGHGTFGITYLAELCQNNDEDASSMLVCIKEFFMSDINSREGSSVSSSSQGSLFQNYARKFNREAHNLKKLRHENVVKVIELFEANRTYYYSMSFLSGGSLNEMIESRGSLDELTALKIASKVTEALESLHNIGMVHLDIKPGNIMMVGGTVPVLIDFGLSKNFDENGVPESSTSLGGGTPGYSPLEQSSYSAGVGVPVTMDIYALGATLFKMLSGEKPPVASIILQDGFPFVMLHRLGISDETIGIIGKSMEPRCKDRYQSMAEMRKAINKKLASMGVNVKAEAESETVVNKENKGNRMVVVAAENQSGSDRDMNPPQPTKKGLGTDVENRGIVPPPHEPPVRMTPPPRVNTADRIPVSKEAQPPMPKKKNRLWLWILLAILALLIILAL